MNIEEKKLGLISRFIKLKEERAINQLELAITQLEMDERTEESMQAIENGDVISLTEFKAEAEEWLNRKRSTK